MNLPPSWVISRKCGVFAHQWRVLRVWDRYWMVSWCWAWECSLIANSVDVTTYSELWDTAWTRIRHGSVFRSNFTIPSWQGKNIIQSESFNRLISNNKSFIDQSWLATFKWCQGDKPNRPRRFSTEAIFFFISDEFIKLCTILERRTKDQEGWPRGFTLGGLSRKQAHGRLD